jgi:hypothetical protein
MPDKERAIGSHLRGSRQAGAAGVQSILSYGLDTVEDQQIAEVYVGTLSNTTQFFNVLGYAFLGERKIFSGVKDSFLPIGNAHPYSLFFEMTPIDRQHFLYHLLSICTDLPPHIVVVPGGIHNRDALAVTKGSAGRRQGG